MLICVAILSVICPHHTIADVPPHAKDKDEERWAEADECFFNAVAKVEMRCKDMTEGVVLGNREGCIRVPHGGPEACLYGLHGMLHICD